MFRAKSQSYQTLLFRVVSVFWGICTHGQRLACNLLYFHHVFFWCCCWWVCAKFCYAADSAWVQQQGHAETGSWKQPAWRTVAKGQWCCWTGPGRGPVHAGQSMTRPNRFLKLSRLARGRWKLMRRLNAIQTLCGHWSAFCSPSILRVLFVASLFALKQFVAGGAKHLRSTSYLSFFAAKMFCFHKISLFLRFLWQRCQCTPQVVKILVAALCVTMCASTEVDWAAGSFAWNQCLKPRPRGFVYSLAWARSCCFFGPAVRPNKMRFNKPTKAWTAYSFVESFGFLFCKRSCAAGPPEYPQGKMTSAENLYRWRLVSERLRWEPSSLKVGWAV